MEPLARPAVMRLARRLALPGGIDAVRQHVEAREGEAPPEPSGGHGRTTLRARAV